MAKGGGGKLNKSETVQVRLDPILKLAAELAAAQDRRTLSSFTEMAVDRMAQQVQVARDDAGNPVSAYQVARECWDANSWISLQTLAARYPDLLTTRERKIVQAWRFAELLLSEERGIRRGVSMDLIIGRNWQTLCRYADEQITLDELAQQVRAFA